MTAAEGTTAIRRAELADFLKARRARVQPADVGLPAGGRRRTPGLRREEVALLAGVGVTWYTWLEQGRPINASWQVLDAVAGALKLDGSERWHLYRLSDATPLRTCTGEVPLPDWVTAIMDGLHPLPATVTNARLDVLVSNQASKDLFRDWHTLPCVHMNLLWCCLTEPSARDRLLNYDDEVAYMVARLRTEYGRHLDDPDWTEDIRRLSELSPEFRTLWARHEVTHPQTRIRHHNHPTAGELRIATAELEIPAMPGIRLFVGTPADEESWRRLPRIRDAAAADAQDHIIANIGR